MKSGFALPLLLVLACCLAGLGCLGCLGCGWSAQRERDLDRPLSLAPVEQVRIQAVSEARLTATATVNGTLPDGCTEIHNVSRHRSGRDFEITLTTRRRPAEGCGAEPQPYQRSIDIFLAATDFGQYNIVVNGVSASFYVSSDPTLRREGLDTGLTPFP